MKRLLNYFRAMLRFSTAPAPVPAMTAITAQVSSDLLAPHKDLLSRMSIGIDDIILQLEGLLSKQIPGSKILEFSITENPETLCALGEENSDGISILNKFGIAIPFHATIEYSSDNNSHLNAVFSWVITNIGNPELVHSRLWLDVGGDINKLGASGELVNRLYSGNQI